MIDIIGMLSYAILKNLWWSINLDIYLLVDKKIHERAGKGLKDVCRSLPDLGVGESEITPGFLLPAKCKFSKSGNDSGHQLCKLFN